MAHHTTTYTAPENGDSTMAKEAMALQYNNIDALQQQCMDMVRQIKDSSMLMELIHKLGQMVSTKEEALEPYTIEELQQRCDEATAELEAGGGIDGDTFFKELNEYIESL